MPAVIGLETMDEVFGRLIAFVSSYHKHRVRFAERDDIDTLWQGVALRLQIRHTRRDEQTFGVVLLESEHLVMIDGIEIIDDGSGDIDRHIFLINNLFVTGRARCHQRACKSQKEYFFHMHINKGSTHECAHRLITMSLFYFPYVAICNMGGVKLNIDFCVVILLSIAGAKVQQKNDMCK